MTQWFEANLGPTVGPMVTVMIWAMIIVAIFAMGFWAFRAATGLHFRKRWNGDVRLDVIDATTIDNRRRLVLVRRDDVEHLIVIGGHNDFVVESGIKRPHKAANVQRPASKPAPQPSKTASKPAAAKPTRAASSPAPAPSQPAPAKPEPAKKPAIVQEQKPVEPAVAAAKPAPVESTPLQAVPAPVLVSDAVAEPVEKAPAPEPAAPSPAPEPVQSEAPKAAEPATVMSFEDRLRQASKSADDDEEIDIDIAVDRLMTELDLKKN